MGKFLRQLTVIGEQQQARCISVEAAYGIHTFLCRLCNKRHDRFSSPLIFHRSDKSRRFVEEDIYRPDRNNDLSAIGNPVAGHDLVSHFGNDLSVYFYVARGDQLVAFPACRDARIGEIFIQADAFFGKMLPAGFRD